MTLIEHRSPSGSSSAVALAGRPRRPLAVASARLEVICGCMFSGKSEELIRRLVRADIGRQRVVVGGAESYEARCRTCFTVPDRPQ